MSGSSINKQNLVISGLFVLLALFFAFLLYSRTKNSPSISIEDTVNNATIYLSSNRQTVLLPTDCVTLEWDVEGIQSVYLGDQGVNGQGNTKWCLSNGTTPYLHINFTDGTSKQYPLELSYAIISFESVYAVLCLVIGLYLLRIPILTQGINSIIQNENRLSYLICAWIIAVIYVFWVANDYYGLNEFTALTHNIHQYLGEHFTAPYQG